MLLFQAALKHHASRAIYWAENLLGLNFIPHGLDSQFTRPVQVDLVAGKIAAEIVLLKVVGLLNPVFYFFIIIDID